MAGVVTMNRGFHYYFSSRSEERTISRSILLMKLKRRFNIALVLGALLVNGALSTHAQTTAFYFTSSRSSWIGQGQTLLASSANGYTINHVLGLNQYEVAFDVIPTPSTGNWWWLEMNNPQGASPYLTNGLYENAERLGGNAGPGLSFYGAGRGDNTSTGYFNVLDIVYDANHNLLSFAADFVQYDYGLTTEWNQGSIRYNSIIPIPEPATPALLIFGLGRLGRRLRIGQG